MAETLTDFLLNNEVGSLTKDVYISTRIKFPFKIKAMTNDEMDKIKRKLAGFKGNNEALLEKYYDEIIVNQTVEPAFNAKEFIDKLQVVNGVEAMHKVLLSGEIVELRNQILEFSGFNIDINRLIQEAKK